MRKYTQQLVAFGFGVVFVVALLVLAVVLPDPTDFQYLVFRVVLALAAAGVAAMIPGFISVEIANWLRAGGALAVFAVVYFYNPALQLHRALVPPLEAKVTLDRGAYEAVELVGLLGELTGGIVVDPDLAAKLEGRPVRLATPLEDVSLRVALDLIFKQLGLVVEYELNNETVVIHEKE